MALKSVISSQISCFLYYIVHFELTYNIVKLSWLYSIIIAQRLTNPIYYNLSRFRMASAYKYFADSGV